MEVRVPEIAARELNSRLAARPTGAMAAAAMVTDAIPDELDHQEVRKLQQSTKGGECSGNV
jgi:hypothetical protein